MLGNFYVCYTRTFLKQTVPHIALDMPCFFRGPFLIDNCC